MSLLPERVSAQRRPFWSIVADNDYFNFWQPVSQRPDLEYTQGIQIRLAFPIAPRHLPRWVPHRLLCALLTDRCPWFSVGLSQEIYNPSVDAPTLQAGQRPYAGWLAAHIGWAQHTHRDMEEIELSVGVTGSPSLAEFSQTRVHRLLGYREPLGWSGQLPTEPGVFVAYQRAHEVWNSSTTGLLGVRVGLLGGARVGTVRVDGTGGVHLALGLRPPAPRPIDLTRPSGRLSIHASASAQIDVVGRNEFIQGTLLRPSPSLPLRHLVPQLSAGLHARIGRVMIGWVVTHRDREYPTQPKPHTYSSLGLSIGP